LWADLWSAYAQVVFEEEYVVVQVEVEFSAGDNPVEKTIFPKCLFRRRAVPLPIIT
jgi:hypothetical protein